MSLNSRYSVAVHTLLLLQDPDGDWVTSEWIAGSVNTNPVVIRRILARLVGSGLVEGRKGAAGGYRLLRPAREVTLWDAYEAMREEGPFGLHAAEPNPGCPIGRNIQRELVRVYAEAERAMRPVLERTTLRDLYGQVVTRAG
jgi:Rrf2 family protein